MEKILFLIIAIFLSINYMAIAIDYSTLYFKAPNNSYNPTTLDLNRAIGIKKYPYKVYRGSFNSYKPYYKTTYNMREANRTGKNTYRFQNKKRLMNGGFQNYLY